MAQLEEGPRFTPRPRATEVSVAFEAGAALITLAGEIDLAVKDCLDFVADQAIDRDLPVRVDVSRVTFMDSTGLSLLIRLAATERKSGRTLRVEGADRRVRDLLDVAGVSQVLDLTALERSGAKAQNETGAAALKP